MPPLTLAKLLIGVVAAAALTVAVALMLLGDVAVSSLPGLVILSLIALCASFAWRRYANRSTNDR